MPPVENMESEVADDVSFADLEEGAGEGEEQGFDMDLHQDNWDVPVEGTKGSKKSTQQTENLDVEEGDLEDLSKDKELTDEELEAKETKVAKEKAEEVIEDAAEEAKPVGKVHKATLNGKEVTLDDGMVLRKKIDGKMVDIKLSDALDSFAGKQSYDKKFADIAIEKKNMTAMTQKVQQYEAHLKKEIGSIENLVAQVLEGKANPLEPIKKLLDMQGKDSFVYYKKTMEALFEEFNQLYDMDENQQAAFWTKKENEHLRERQTRISQMQAREQEDRQVLSQVEAAHEEFGITFEQHNEAIDSLLSIKGKDGKPVYTEKALLANPRAVAQYAAKAPYITKAEELVKPFEENISDDDLITVVDEMTRILYESKGKDEPEVLAWLEQKFGVSDAVRALNKRLEKSGAGASKKASGDDKYKVKTKAKQEDEVEDFDDLDL